jgi:hypothetical protein
MMAATAPAPVRAPTAVTPHNPVRLWLWLPLTPLFLLLAPFAMLVAPLVWLGLPQRPRNPFTAALAIGGVLLALSGTIVDIDAPGARLFIRIF